jgi:hypothetical protein
MVLYKFANEVFCVDHSTMSSVAAQADLAQADLGLHKQTLVE